MMMMMIVETRRKFAWAPTGLGPKDYDDYYDFSIWISLCHSLSHSIPYYLFLLFIPHSLRIFHSKFLCHYLSIFCFILSKSI